MSEIIWHFSFSDWLISVKIHPLCIIFQNAILFYGQIIFHCVRIPHFLIHSSADGRLGCFLHLAIINKATMNICLPQTSVLVSSCCHYKIPQTGGLNRNLSPHSSGGQKFKIRAQACSGVGRSSLLVSGGCPLVVSSESTVRV